MSHNFGVFPRDGDEEKVSAEVTASYVNSLALKVHWRRYDS
jgi:hypothetical protein